MGQIVGSRFSRIAAPVVGQLAVLAAVGFVLAAPHHLDSSRTQTAIPAPPAGTGEVASVVAPPLETPEPPRPTGRVPPLGPSETPPPSGASAAPPSPATPVTGPGIAPTERPSGGGISATPSPGVGRGPDQDDGDGHGRPAKNKAHKHQGHGKGHEHHGNGNGVGHSGDDGGRHDNGKHGHGKHNGWTKPDKNPPPKASHSLGSGHGNGKKPDREHGQGAKHGKSGGRGHSHSRSRR